MAEMVPQGQVVVAVAQVVDQQLHLMVVLVLQALHHSLKHPTQQQQELAEAVAVLLMALLLVMLVEQQVFTVVAVAVAVMVLAQVAEVQLHKVSSYSHILPQ
jgi:hypothetical protein